MTGDMILGLLFGSKHERDIRRLRPLVERINALEPDLQRLSDADFPAKTREFRERIGRGEKPDLLLTETFALAREAARRTIGLRPFDVQVMGGIVLHQGKIAEMRTGEGKTLAAVLPACLNALSGRGVHIITVNDYLARRDAEWMGPVYRLLGVSVGVLQEDMETGPRQRAYACDITYGTNSEFGFDYLRDNMAQAANERVQRGFAYAVVDEIDSILIDEARTPLIIADDAADPLERYRQADRVIAKLSPDRDYVVNRKEKTALLTDDGVKRVESLLKLDNLYRPEHIEWVHHVRQALRAHALFKRDVDYVVDDGSVIIVDEFTGRLQPDRRYSDGLHQALEAKEGIRVRREEQTYASISLQNFCRMYAKLSGMTGTADTEAGEFKSIYRCDVVAIPPNKPGIRIDHPDRIFKTEKEKFAAVAEQVQELHATDRPVLIGTVSIEKSEQLSALLKKQRIPHSVLNAKQHSREAAIIAEAGLPGAVTIATNMAGRGVDIILGGQRSSAQGTAPDPDWEKRHRAVVDAGGLYIIGTERHEAQRIDNQLRGRSGRQGDPGESRFFLSLEDDLVRAYAADPFVKIPSSYAVLDGGEIPDRSMRRAFDVMQKRAESTNFESRKHVLEYDDVMNIQREIMYRERRRLIDDADMLSLLREYLRDVCGGQLTELREADDPELVVSDAFAGFLRSAFGFDCEREGVDAGNYAEDELSELVVEALVKRYEDSRQSARGRRDDVIRRTALQVVDSRWLEHLLIMEDLEDGIWTEGYGERNPIVEFRIRGFQIFNGMLLGIKRDIAAMLVRPGNA